MSRLTLTWNALRFSNVVFRQLFEHTSSTYTYLLSCASTREAIIIDPVIEMIDRDLNLIQELNMKLIYAANTHVHADHVTGSGEIKKRVPGVQSIISEASKASADVRVKHGDKIKFGAQELEVRSTPGHTDGCTTYVCHEESIAFTGDALLIRGCGRTDFQQGSPGLLYDSVHSQIFTLPKHFILFPAHDYKGMMCTSVDEESKFNPRLTKSKEEFIKIMNGLNLAHPKQIDKAVPANMVCGIFENMDDKTRKLVEQTFGKK